MATEKYIVLRLDRPATLEAPVGIAMRGLGAEAAVSIESADLSGDEYLDLARDRSILAAVRPFPTKLMEPQAGTAPTGAAVTWGVEQVGAPASAFSGAGVKVAVLDTGIDRNHVAFVGVNVHEQDFSGDGNGDRQGHGTHCAGTIFGRDVGGLRIGVARGVTHAFVGKVLNDRGGGDSEMLFRGIQWALSNNAGVISMSLGFDFPGFVDHLVNQRGYPVNLATSIALREYLATARAFDALMQFAKAQIPFNGGTVVVAAAGNESQPNLPIGASLPAVAEDVVAVGAVAKQGTQLISAPFSNVYPQVVAPGVNVVSARSGGGTVAFNGTSMACPHVAGVAALYWEAVRGDGILANSAQVLRRLIAACDRSSIAGYSQVVHGNGAVRAP